MSWKAHSFHTCWFVCWDSKINQQRAIPLKRARKSWTEHRKTVFCFELYNAWYYIFCKKCQSKTLPFLVWNSGIKLQSRASSFLRFSTKFALCNIILFIFPWKVSRFWWSLHALEHCHRKRWKTQWNRQVQLQKKFVLRVRVPIEIHISV